MASPVSKSAYSRTPTTPSVVHAERLAVCVLNTTRLRDWRKQRVHFKHGRPVMQSTVGLSCPFFSFSSAICLHYLSTQANPASITYVGDESGGKTSHFEYALAFVHRHTGETVYRDCRVYQMRCVHESDRHFDDRKK
jgi:hypothetical protein